jgi:hypothetical protein
VCLYLIPVVWLGLCFAWLMMVRHRAYSDVLQWYAGRWPNAFDVKTMRDVCFTPARDRFLADHSGLLMTGVAFVAAVYFVMGRRVLAVLRECVEAAGMVLSSMKEAYGRCSLRERTLMGGLFGAILAYRLYWVLAAPMHPDELCSYLYFARQGWWVTATCYPLPNNHILFNLIVSALNLVPGLSPGLVMRLPSVLSDLLLQALIFWLFLRWGGYWRAMAVVLGTAFCYLLSYYATHGRGYGMQELCALVTGVAAWRRWVGGKEDGVALFVVFSVAGLYINPAFVYHFTAVVLFCGWRLWRSKDRKGGFELVRAVLLTGWLGFILYLPMLLVSGAGGLSEEVTVFGVGAGEGWSWLIHRLPDLAYDFKVMIYYGRPGFWMFCGLALLGGWLYRSGRLRGPFYDGFAGYFIATAISFLFWSIPARRYPYDRTLVYLALALSLVFMNACYDLWRSRPGSRNWVFGCFLVIKLAGSVRGLVWERYSLDSLPEALCSRVVRQDLDRLWEMHPGSWQITKSNDYYPMYLGLYLIEHRDGARVIRDRERAVGDVLFLPVIYRGNFERKGYRVWGENRLTVEGAMGMEIDVAGRLGGVQK